MKKDKEKISVFAEEETIVKKDGEVIEEKIEVTDKFDGYDDEAEATKEQLERDEKSEADKLLPPDPEAILEVRHLKKFFVLKKTLTGKPLSTLKAVDDVSFKVKPGETLGIVGESGCGKTTMGRTILKLYQPTDGQVFFHGEDVSKYSPKQMRALRTKMQIVFQDPYSSLNPRKHIYEILAQPMLYHHISTAQTVEKDLLRILDMVGLPRNVLGRYPHEFSGGQRQRIGIAKALSLNPRFIVCDEPVSALDVSIQAQILNLLKSLQEELHLTLLFVGHGLGAVNYVSSRIAVMYLGRIVEMGEAKEIFRNPHHPYTQALLNAVPVPDPEEKGRKRELLQGEIGNSVNPPSGCHFHPRCPYAAPICSQKEPGLQEICAGSSHFSACPIVQAKKEESSRG